MTPVQNWLAATVVRYFLREVADWGQDFDWAVFREKTCDQVAALLYGDWFDEVGRDITGALIDRLETVIGQAVHFDAIAIWVLDNEYKKAGALLKDLLLRAWRPASNEAISAMVLVENL